ncbi:hypothetical protein BpHYR1_032629 [Brachionus plicatilis]|uniref:Uncharacterized protein n=1 Tax=Brachionus plicatilis TaxID=10195 RepID=A0A3M7P8U6_BRAPC|nr:hypothetical protein BpHYR1_032629 [Brachionus plicatilis]
MVTLERAGKVLCRNSSFIKPYVSTSDDKNKWLFDEDKVKIESDAKTELSDSLESGGVIQDESVQKSNDTESFNTVEEVEAEDSLEEAFNANEQEEGEDMSDSGDVDNDSKGRDTGRPKRNRTKPDRYGNPIPH